MVRALALVAALAAAFIVTQPPVPACEEDAVIVGIGEFDGGRWSEYICGPSFDSYAQEDDLR